MLSCHPRTIFLWIFLGLFCSSQIIFAQETPSTKPPDLKTELTPTQLKIVQSGGQVMTTTKVPGKIWPKVLIYQIIPALPEEVIAVFFDYEAAHTYVPNLLQSTISKKIDAFTHEVDYRLNIPLMPNEQYTARNSLHLLPGGTYEITWKLLRATTTRFSEGNFRIQPYGKDHSIFCYSNFVVPGSNLAIVLRGIALEQVQKNVEALVTQVAKQKSQYSESLHRQVEVLRKALEKTSPQ